MGLNILITGAAGYIGGSILADFISQSGGPIKDANITAAVRSKEQLQALSKLGINVIQLDVSDEKAVDEAVACNKIDIVVHTASSIIPSHPAHLIKALGRRRNVTGEPTYFIHSSVTTMYSAEGGWPFGEVKDSDPIYEREKEIGGPNPVRLTNICVTEQGKEHGVTTFNIAVPFTYGRGTGEWRKVSVTIPAFIQSSVAHRIVYKFDQEGKPPAAHISDLVTLYRLLVEKVLQKEPVPSGEKGHYFAVAHRSPWWAVMNRIAASLHKRGLVDEPKVHVWPSDEMAAEYLSWPETYVRAMGASNGDLDPVNARQLGWQPLWDEKKYLDNMDDEVQAILDLDTYRSTLHDSLLSPRK